MFKKLLGTWGLGIALATTATAKSIEVECTFFRVVESDEEISRVCVSRTGLFLIETGDRQGGAAYLYDSKITGIAKRGERDPVYITFALIPLVVKGTTRGVPMSVHVRSEPGARVGGASALYRLIIDHEGTVKIPRRPDPKATNTDRAENFSRFHRTDYLQIVAPVLSDE